MFFHLLHLTQLIGKGDQQLAITLPLKSVQMIRMLLIWVHIGSGQRSSIICFSSINTTKRCYKSIIPDREAVWGCKQHCFHQDSPSPLKSIPQCDTHTWGALQIFGCPKWLSGTDTTMWYPYLNSNTSLRLSSLIVNCLPVHLTEYVEDERLHIKVESLVVKE